MRLQINRRYQVTGDIKKFIKLFILLLIWIGIVNLITHGSEIARNKERIILEQTITKALMRCYILEGKYPDSLDHINKEYNINTSSRYYNIYYETFADNIMPEVKVFERR